MRRMLVAAALLSGAAIAGCSGKDDAPAGDTTPAVVTVDTPRTPRPGEAACPSDGSWRPCGLLERLVRAGVAPKALDDTVRMATWSVPGLRYRVGRAATLTAFFYADSAAAQRDLARIDTLAMRLPGDTASMPPTFIRSANLVAVFESDNPRQIERVQLAILGGAP